jgi:hypothetical protein
MDHTLVLEVPEEIYQSLVQAAKQKGQSLEQVALYCLTSASEHLSDDPVEPFIGSLRSDVPDWADQHDRHLGRALMKHIQDSEETKYGNG